MNKYFDRDDTVFNITEKYPQLIPFLVKKGFAPLSNPLMRKVMGKRITLRKALESRGLNLESCEDEICSLLENADVNLFSNMDALFDKKPEVDDGKTKLKIEGVLPCPIRIPLVEEFEKFNLEFCKKNEEMLEKANYKVSYDLRSANLGIDWICDQVKTGDEKEIPDILISAGFELFFDKKLMGKFIEEKKFHSTIEKMNSDFCNDELDLRDKKNNYAIIGIVPAIFIVNEDALNGREAPKTWEDLLKPEFKNSVSVPFQDLDLFNAVLLTMYKRFGDEGIRKLANSCGKFLHPAQMVKGKKEEVSAVNVAPYFFTKMLRENSSSYAVWPEDGAIIAPIFMLAKTEPKEIIQPFSDFLMSEEVGRVFADSGFFPSTHPAVDNKIPSDKKFSWIGWDFLYDNDVSELLERLKNDFERIADETSKEV